MKEEKLREKMVEEQMAEMSDEEKEEMMRMKEGTYYQIFNFVHDWYTSGTSLVLEAKYYQSL